MFDVYIFVCDNLERRNRLQKFDRVGLIHFLSSYEIVRGEYKQKNVKRNDPIIEFF